MRERYYHFFFRAGVVIKTIATLVEIVLGSIFYIFPNESINGTILTMISGELAETPRHLPWEYVANNFHGISPETQAMWAFLLLGHGLVKVALVIGLLKERLWAYPVSAVVFGLFVIYQTYQTIFVHSIFLDLLTAFDIVLIFLILHEYRFRTARRA